MFGAHLSVAGGLVNALIEAEQLKMDCVQVFTKNQRQWAAKPLTDPERNDWLAKLRDLGWHLKHGPDRVVSHNSYLINMASPDRAMWKKSVDAQRVELERCEALKIPLCVAHPGAHLGKSRKTGEPHDLQASPTKDELGGLKRIIKALDRIHGDLPGCPAITCLETTVGSGSNLGYTFEQLAFIAEHVKEPERVAFCLDTCHVTAAGYDMTTDASATSVLRLFDEVCGLGMLRVIHVNDSQGDVGSRRDRHAQIGDGRCGKACFRAIVNHRRLARVPRILETPKGTTEKGVAYDVMNIRRLKRLIRGVDSSR